MLGSLPRTSRGPGWWLLPTIDLTAAVLALIGIALVSDHDIFPALPVSALLLIGVNGALGVYGERPSRGVFGGENGMAWPVIRLLAAALFAWSASLMVPMSVASQLALWVLFVVMDGSARAILAPRLQKLDRIERWVLVGDQATAERLRAYAPLRAYASIVATIAPPEDGEDEERSPSRRSRSSTATAPTASSSAPSTPMTRGCSTSSANSSRSACRSACCRGPSICSRRRSRRRARSAASR